MCASVVLCLIPRWPSCIVDWHVDWWFERVNLAFLDDVIVTWGGSLPEYKGSSPLMEDLETNEARR